jgi:hypothetical protein
MNADPDIYPPGFLVLKAIPSTSEPETVFVSSRPKPAPKAKPKVDTEALKRHVGMELQKLTKSRAATAARNQSQPSTRRTPMPMLPPITSATFAGDNTYGPADSNTNSNALAKAMLADGIDIEKLEPAQKMKLAQELCKRMFAKAGYSDQPQFPAGWNG